MANYKVQYVKSCNYKFKTKIRVSIYTTYMTPTYEPKSKNVGGVSQGKIITADKCAVCEITVGSRKGTKMYFYHFPAGQGGVSYDYWVPKYDASGDQWLTTDISSGGQQKQQTIQNNDIVYKEVAPDQTIKGNNNEFDFDRWTQKNGEYNEEWLHLLRSKMIVYQDRNKWQDSYNLMQFVNPYNVQNGTRELLFFTKCDLNIMKNPNQLNPVLAKNAFWNEMQKKYRDQISVLQKGNARRGGVEVDNQPFIPMLTNMVRSRMDLPGISMNTMDTPSTIYGTSIQYAGDSMSSDEGHDFSLEIADTPELEIYHILKMYSEYERLKAKGIVSPPGADGVVSPYTENKILHDQFAIYKFVLSADDMESILFYAKAYGVFFKSVPRDQFGDIQAGEITYNVDFHAQFIKEQEPIILYEFNRTASEYWGGVPDKNKNSYIPIYDKNYQEMNGEFRPCPFITECNNGKKTQSRYKLMWFK